MSVVKGESPHFFQSQVLGHPAGLFVLFFTEIWERFSFYGMRVLLIQYLTAAVVFGSPHSGWGWTPEQAGALYGTYVMLLYLTPILGGVIADRYIGSRLSVIVGAITMTLGHASMAFDTSVTFFLGLALLVIGTGFFKPNMPAMLGEMYKYLPEKKDSAYTIFYMGVNAGAFFGMMLCGYLGETLGWHWGFGLAGIFMLLGTLQFAWAKPLFGDLGSFRKQQNAVEEDCYRPNPFSRLDIVLIGLVGLIGLVYAFNDPLSKNGMGDIFRFMDLPFIRGQFIAILLALGLFLFLVVSRIMRYEQVLRRRMFSVMLLAFFMVFFFMSFEQGATSLVLVARDYTNRALEGSGLLLFNIVNSLFTVVPLLVISYVLVKLGSSTFKKITLSNITLFSCFALLWIVVIWMLWREFQAEVSEIKVSWFSILNAFFIISFASLVSKLWDSKYNPPVAFKYGIGLLLVSLGFLVLAWGAWGLHPGFKMSIIFLILTYLLHTLGELFISPVGLSYVSKLVPVKMLAFMYGVWYLAIAIAQKVAAALGGQIEVVKDNYSLSHFFLLFTAIPALAGVLAMLLHPALKRLMSGIK